VSGASITDKKPTGRNQQTITKEDIMSGHISQPQLTDEGITFTVRVDSVNRDCLITKDALSKLSGLKNIDALDANTMETFHAYEAAIYGVARRLVAARVPGTPLRMNADTFITKVA
jgi:hypothetical protein